MVEGIQTGSDRMHSVGSLLAFIIEGERLGTERGTNPWNVPARTR